MTDQPLSAVRVAVTDRLQAAPSKLRAYWSLTKSLQTGLLIITGLAGYMSGCPTTVTWATIGALLGSLFLTVGGSTVLNMVVDRDIDAKMSRTARRPLPSGTVSAVEGAVLGSTMVILGGHWALQQSASFGGVVLAGGVIDVLVYTCWLKRRTPWSIVLGGIAGGMPVLAGRVLSTGRVDGIGLWLAVAVLLWIPTHIMTFGIKYAADYRHAGVPIFPNRYGITATKLAIGVSTGGATAAMLWAMYALGLSSTLLWIARGLGGALFGFAILTVIHTTPKLNYILYKLASLCMLGSMVVLIAGA